MSYCTFCKTLPEENHHRIYHDFHYGFPIEDDNELFGRFILEINQAGLSWDLLLKKQENFRIAFDNFDIKKIAKYNEKKVEELLLDAGIIRNRLKINAVIHNANVIVSIQEEFGTFKNWIDFQHPKRKEEWVKIFKKTFKFTGGEIVNEFLMSTGYLDGAHDENCETLIQIRNGKNRS
jgi:DNA-3-methyladenine glycosylase I